MSNNTQLPTKLLMREEVLQDGSPLPFASILESTSTLTIDDDTVKALWQKTIARMRELINLHLPTVEIVMPQLWRGDMIKRKVIEKTGMSAVSMDSYDTTGALPLRVSRHFTKGGSTLIGIGERPGTPPLEVQLRDIKCEVNDSPIVLFEDDMYTGSTVTEILRRMQAIGITIIKFVPGIQVSEIESIEGVPIEPIERYAQSKVLDVIDPRDFLFGVREAGLVIQDNNLLYRAPYILPWVDLHARASIPDTVARELSIDIINLNTWLHTELQLLLGCPITISHTSRSFQDFTKYATDYSVSGTMLGFCEYARSLFD